MARLFRAFLFKLKRDMTFRITLFIGIGMAIFMSLLYVILEKVVFDPESDIKLISGESMLIQSLSPVQNFGIAIPVNLISFTVLEFTHGTIRNKIIAGNSKFKIYASLYLSGLVFTISLITVYALLCLGLGSLFGGYRPIDGSSAGLFGMARVGEGYTLRLIISALFAYISITSFAILIATLTRQIGGSIPIVILVLLFAYLAANILSSLAFAGEDQESKYNTAIWILRIIDPLYASASQELVRAQEGESGVIAYQIIKDETFICGIINNVVYTVLFFALGAFIFKKRDVK